MSSKLWEKNYTLDSLMEEFTVSNDYIIDENLILSDSVASIAQAKGLYRIGILNKDELDSLTSGLEEIIRLYREGSFKIDIEDEDVHTAIENRLTSISAAGGKIHTGRSRNDQSLTAIRLYMREALVKCVKYANTLVNSLISLSDRSKDIPMPGRTHMQKAMPSSVSLWALSFAEELIDEIKDLISLYPIIDQSPLGSAASYGTTLNTDREYLASLMGFSKVQNNVLYANNSRGKFESMLLDRLSYIVLTISKISQDLLLFTLPELGYFSLPDELTTGSSIMPQKKNPDGLELIRSRTALVLSLDGEVKSIIKALPSGYNRDFQDTKEPLIRGIKESVLIIKIMDEIILRIRVNRDRLIDSCTSEIYATDKALEMSVKGTPFRASYKKVALNLDSVDREDPVEALKRRTLTGSTGNLKDEIAKGESSKIKEWADDKTGYLKGVYNSLTSLVDELTTF